jgi:hypothetical protein
MSKCFERAYCHSRSRAEHLTLAEISKNLVGIDGGAKPGRNLFLLNRIHLERLHGEEIPPGSYRRVAQLILEVIGFGLFPVRQRAAAPSTPIRCSSLEEKLRLASKKQ